MFRSLHTWLTHMSLWHYWFWVTFTAFMNLFFMILFKVFTYQRADISGTRSVGEKRRIAWPEMLIVLFPLFWAINIITNALAYLSILEGSSGYVFTTVSVMAYQWGWKYCYDDSFYPKFHSNYFIVGDNSYLSPGIPSNMSSSKYSSMGDNYLELSKEEHSDFSVFSAYKGVVQLRLIAPWEVQVDQLDYVGQPVSEVIDSKKANMGKEIYFCSYWLKEAGVMDNETKKLLNNKLWQTGYWVISQGVDANEPTFEDLSSNSKSIVTDPLRLLRSSGALVVPTRSTLSLTSSSEDITHSWAVPGLGFKMDCVPGSLFCLYTNMVSEGVYFGQCSELCGWNHYNMPVVLYALPVEHFIVWWEIELHAIFDEPCSMLQNDKNFNDVKYSLLNVKYK